jgi:hypothetical protein
LDEAAELALHLMYSSALKLESAAYLYKCINLIYSQGGLEGSILTSWRMNTRGKGKLHLNHMVRDLDQSLGMLLSGYKLSEALKNMRATMFNPSRVDYLDRHLATLQPAHRLAFVHFRESGILAPFSADTSHFIEPNRCVQRSVVNIPGLTSFSLLFSAEGEWLTLDNANPLFGWDMVTIKASGKRHGVESADIYGCLFYHIKDEFMEFARRVRDFNISIFLTQFPATVLAHSISDGMLDPFGPQCFDRVETSNMVDTFGVPAILDDWGHLLNRRNKHACLLMYFMNWHVKQPKGTATALDGNPLALRSLMKRCTEMMVSCPGPIACGVIELAIGHQHELNLI